MPHRMNGKSIETRLNLLMELLKDDYNIELKEHYVGHDESCFKIFLTDRKKPLDLNIEAESGEIDAFKKAFEEFEPTDTLTKLECLTDMMELRRNPCKIGAMFVDTAMVKSLHRLYTETTDRNVEYVRWYFVDVTVGEMKRLGAYVNTFDQVHIYSAKTKKFKMFISREADCYLFSVNEYDRPISIHQSYFQKWWHTYNKEDLDDNDLVTTDTPYTNEEADD